MDLDDLKYIGKKPRRTGRSTRLIDQYVQDIFKNGHVTIQDHFIDGIPAGEQTNKWLAQRFLDRMTSEHPNLKIDFKEDERRRGIFVATIKNK